MATVDIYDVEELAEIKKTICSYFSLSLQSSTLTFRKINTLDFRGDNTYYDLLIQNGHDRHRIFGKLTPHADKEYHNLQYIQKINPTQEIHLPRPIALVEIGSGSLLLQEYLEGYSHVLENRKLKYYLPGRSAAIENTGRTILNKIYNLQRMFSVSLSPLSAEDVRGFPNQPKPIGVYYQLDTVHALSDETKSQLRTRLRAIVINKTPVRRGVIHGDLGMRNIMENNSSVSIIDWGYMQTNGVSLIDPCFFVVMLLMKSIQLLVPWGRVTSSGDNLFRQIKLLEEGMVDSENTKFINDSIWYGKCLSLIDTLWWYEKDNINYLKNIMKQRSRQVKYLTYLIDREAANG